MMHFSKTELYNVPGSFSIGEAYTAALISYIQDNPILYDKVTDGKRDVKIIAAKYKEAAGKFINGTAGEGLPDFMTFGIIWELFGEQLFGYDNAMEIEERIVMLIDIIDKSAGAEPLEEITVLIEKAGLDKPYKSLNTEFTRKISKFKKMMAIDFNQMLADMQAENAV